MSSNDKFWAVTNFFFGFMIIFTVVHAVSDYWKDHNTKIVQLIKEGTPPVEAMCAMQNDYGKHPTCIIIATKSAEMKD